MKIRGTFLILIIVITSQLWAVSGIGNKFIFDESKLDVGNLYIYKYSDYEGKQITYQYLYINSEDSIEYLWDLYDDGNGLLRFKQDINRDYFMYDRIEQENILPASDKYTKSALITNEFNPSKITYNSVKVSKGKEKTNSATYEIDKVKYYPYFKSGNCTDGIALFFRFYNRDSKDKQITIIDVWNKPYDYEVLFDKEEIIDGIATIKYKLKPAGAFAKMLDKTGYIWIARDDPRSYVVKYKLNLRIGWDLMNEMVVLKEIRPLTYSGWESFIQDKKEEREQGLGF